MISQDLTISRYGDIGHLDHILHVVHMPTVCPTGTPVDVVYMVSVEVSILRTSNRSILDLDLDLILDL